MRCRFASLALWLWAIAAPLDAQIDVPTYTEAFIGEFQRLNPYWAAPNSNEAAVSSLLFEGLFTLNRFGEIIPLLAQDVYISQDGLEYVVWLRGQPAESGPALHPPALWHDGLPVTAQDVVFTLSLLRSRNFPGDPALRDFWRTVESYALSEFAVRFRLAQPLASFMDALRTPILPEHALRGVRAAELFLHPFNLDPIGSGPYQLASLHSEDGLHISEIILERAPNFAERSVDPFALERIRFRRYEDLAAVIAAATAGEIDGYASRHFSERNALLETPFLIHSTIAPVIGMLLLQWEHEWLADLRIRRALRESLPVPQVIQTALPNLVVSADAPLLATSWAYVPSPAPTIDAATARENLHQSLADYENDAEAWTLRLLLRDIPPMRALAQEIADRFQALSLTLTLDARPDSEFQAALAARDFDLALVELDFSGSADPDVYDFWHEGQIETGQNYAAVANRRISQALEHARRDTNGFHRRAHYADFQQAFVEAAVAIPFYSPLYTYAIHPDIEGVQWGQLDSSSARFRKIGHWYRAKEAENE
ncbi:MAG: ABC transporter substrate-binding protein [Chloroflexi bacterium]|nr:ABC transporter substrate-binding protein [Chloroflexota bacterium]